MRVRLEARGNPDFDQPDEMGIPFLIADVVDFAHASDTCRAYIEEFGLGGGNWAGGQVEDDAGRVIARVSYNGKVWPPGTWGTDTKPLWEPK